MIALLFLGIILGLVVSPLVEYVLLRILAHKKPKPPVYRTVHRPTEKQKKLLNASTQACKDMNWFNIALQRFFLELSQSYAFKDKLKKTLLKKIKSVSKVIKISIDEIDFGTECPVLSNIRVLSENEIVKIAQSYKAAKFKTGNIDDELAKDISKIETEGSEEKSTSEIEYEPSVIIEDETNDPIPLQCEEDQIDFDNIKYYFEMEYSGNYRVKATVKLPGIKTVPVSFTLHYLKGPIILRLPAKLNHTRFEFSILNIDRLEFRIESDLMNKYIKKTVSNMMHKFFVLFFKGTYVYPNFYTQYLPNVIPSMREIIYPYKNIRSEDEALECFEFLLIVMSMDFRMTKVIEGIIFRRTNYYVNNSKKRVLMCDFNIKNSIKQYGEGTDNNETTKYIDDALVESFFKCMILELEIFKDCITNFKGVELVSEYSNYARVNLHFDDSIYPFNRFVNKDCVIFQSDSSNEFFAFRIRSLQVFEIIFYTQNKDYTINERRIQGIRDKIERCSLSSIKEMNKQGISGLKNSKDIINDNNKFDFILELYNAILNENIDVFDGTYLKTKDINIGEKTDILYEMIIKDISIRLKLIYDTFTVLETTGIDEFIETKVLHKGCHKKVLSLIKNNIVIDVIDKKHLICFNLDNRTVKLYYNEQIVSSRYHSFIYTTKLLERIYNYKNDSNPLFVSQLNEHKFERDFKVKNTSFCVELTVSCNDEMYFYIYNRTTRKYLIERLKISGNKNKLTRVIVPISKPSTIMVHVKSKEGYLDNSLKIYTNDSEEYLNEKMIQTQIELSKKKRFEMNFDGQPDYSLYWDFSESALACYMNDGSAVSVSGTGFNLVSKKKYSIHMLSKNKQKLGMEMNVGMFKIIN